MKKKKSLLMLLFVLLAVPMLLAFKPANVEAATDHGQLHQKVIDGKKYFIYDDGTRLTGWYKLATFKLYLDPKDNGAAVVGYHNIDGGEYVFNKDGVVNCIYGTPVIDGKKYWVTGDGTIRTGWQHLGSMKLYFDPEKKYALTGIHKVDGKYYYFNNDGVVNEQAGTPVINGKKYWFKEDGSLGSGWLKLTNWIMYFDENNFEAAVGRKEVDGEKYLFNKDGVCYIRSRTDVIEGHKYWYNSDGTLTTGWAKLLNWTLYFFPDTWYAAVGDVTIDGVQYTFNSDGVLTSGNSPFDNPVKPTPTPTPTPSKPTPTPTPTPSKPTPTPTPTPSKPTPTPTPTPSKPTPTPTPVPPTPTPTPTPEPTPVPLTVTLDQETVNIDGGKELQLTYKTNRAPDGYAIWESADQSVAQVYPNGMLYAIGGGETDITLTIDGVSDTCHVVVTDVVEYYNNDTLARELFNLVNEYRKSKGLWEWTWDDTLSYPESKMKAMYNVTTAAKGDTSALATHGGSQLGIGSTGLSTAETFLNDWKGSVLHNANLLNNGDTIYTGACSVGVKVLNGKVSAVSVILTYGPSVEVIAGATDEQIIDDITSITGLNYNTNKYLLDYEDR